MSYLILKPKTKKQEKFFIDLAQLLKVPVQKIEPQFLAGGKATKKELEVLFSKPLGKLSTAKQLLAELKDRNAKKR